MAEVTATDGGGAYWRDGAGTWRYAGSDDAVPGAHDLRLRDLYAPPLRAAGEGDAPAPEQTAAGAVAGRADEAVPDAPPTARAERNPDAVPAAAAAPADAVRVVPRSWASRHPDHPLAWIFTYAPLGGRDAVAVPAWAWDERADTVVAMGAPELHPWNLLGVDGVAELLGVAPPTVRAYLARGQMPEPLVRLGGSPVWPRALIERWVPTRRPAAPRPAGLTEPTEAAGPLEQTGPMEPTGPMAPAAPTEPAARNDPDDRAGPAVPAPDRGADAG